MIGRRARGLGASKAGGRPGAIFREQLEDGYRIVDRLFAVLLPIEWMASIVVALKYSPTAWSGETVRTHVHVWAAVFLGGVTVSLPTLLALARPGRASTRQCVAIGQMLMVALLIHLAGGRPEFHFHVFVSLAFLALYRDWRVLLGASTLVAIDHFFRGVYFPRSVFGLAVAQPWRWAEHAFWVVFEDIILIFGIEQSLRVLKLAAHRQSEVEATRDRVEMVVAELRQARDELETRVRDRTAELERTNGALRDEVVERAKAETEALRSREVAEIATRAKSEFLANMSHEIRTPMNAIIGMTELTLGLELAKPQRENLEIVRGAADALLDLIDDILDFSKVEAGKLDLEPVEFSPRDTIDSALKTLSLRAKEKGLTLTNSVAPEVPQALIGDPLRLRQVLLNLLGNAIKFTSKGAVGIGVVVENSGAGDLVLRFSITDQGIGIPESRLAMIFDPFSQADGSTTRRFGGTGLGLSISTKLVALMGGRIWVESEVDRGSTFHFNARFGTVSRLPIPRPSEPESTPRTARAEADRKLRILLVDDNPLNRRVGFLLVQGLGHEVVLAVDGPDAIARSEVEGPFDLILMDVQMPGMDGFEATATIREIQGRHGRKSPIVGLTAHAMKGDREHCLSHGMDDHLAKPIRSADLTRVIRALVEEEVIVDAPISSCLDLDKIRSSLRGNDADVSEVVALFRETCVEQVAVMKGATAENDPGSLARAAHVLLGCLGMFVKEATVELVGQIEAAAQSGNCSGAEKPLKQFETAIAGMQSTLDRLDKRPTSPGPRRSLAGASHD